MNMAWYGKSIIYHVIDIRQIYDMAENSTDTINQHLYVTDMVNSDMFFFSVKDLFWVDDE